MVQLGGIKLNYTNNHLVYGVAHLSLKTKCTTKLKAPIFVAAQAELAQNGTKTGTRYQCYYYILMIYGRLFVIMGSNVESLG